MKLFKVHAGTMGYLLVDGNVMPVLRPWTVRKDMIFEREDLVGDPVTQINGEDNYPLTIGYDLIKRGYSLFNPPQCSTKGWHGTGQWRKPKYTLVVPFAQVETF